MRATSGPKPTIYHQFVIPPKPKPPPDSWWVGLPPAAFYASLPAQVARMHASKIAVYVNPSIREHWM